MGRGNFERTILSCLSCRVGVLSSGGLNIFGVPPTIRLCQSVSRRFEFSTDTGERKRPYRIKVGDKIYVIKTETTDDENQLMKSAKSSGAMSEVDILFAKKPRYRNASSKRVDAVGRIKTTAHPLRLGGPEIKTSESSGKDLLVNTSKKLTDYQDCRVSSESESIHFEPPTTPLCTTEGLVLESILRQPLYNNQSLKPFLTDSDTLKLEKNAFTPSQYPFYVATLRQITQCTASPLSSQNSASWTESNLKKLGTDGFSDFKQDLIQHGRDFENLMVEYLEKGDETLCAVSPVLEACWESVKPVLKDLKNPQCFQTKVVHPQLRYAGYIDCIATYKSKPVLVLWKKTSFKRKTIHYGSEFPLQAVGLLGALNFDPSWSHQIKGCILILAYPDGSCADVYPISLRDSQVSWKLWLRKLEQFWKTYDLNGAKSKATAKHHSRGEPSKVNDSSAKIEAVFDEQPAVFPGTYTSEVDKTNVTSLQNHSSEDPALVDPPKIPVDISFSKNQEQQNINAVDVKQEEISFSKNQEHQKIDAVDVKPAEPEPQWKPHTSDKVENASQSNPVTKSKEKEGLLKSLWTLWKS